MQLIVLRNVILVIRLISYIPQANLDDPTLEEA